MHAQKPKFAASTWNTLGVSTEFPASISANSVLTVSRTMKLCPVVLYLQWCTESVNLLSYRYHLEGSGSRITGNLGYQAMFPEFSLLSNLLSEYHTLSFASFQDFLSPKRTTMTSQVKMEDTTDGLSKEKSCHDNTNKDVAGTSSNAQGFRRSSRRRVAPPVFVPQQKRKVYRHWSPAEKFALLRYLNRYDT